VYGGSELNSILKGKKDLGIITSGLNFGYTMEALDQLGISDASILKLGLVYPLSAQVLKAFCKDLEKVIIIEELEPFIETHLKKIAFEKKLKINIVGKEIFPPWGCLSATLVTRILSRHLKLDLPTELKELDERKIQDRESLMDVPERMPTLCSGCPHRGSAYAVRKATKGKAVYGSEIGCYSLLRQAPWKLTDYGICMGAGIGISQGMSHKLKGRPLVAFIGDSSLFHSGLPAVLNAAYYDAEVLLIVLDNRWTAMTGHQPIPSTGMDVTGEPLNTIPVEQVLRGLGAKKIWFADPFKPEKMAKIVSEALKDSGFRVIISQGECILQTQRRERLQGTFEKKEFVIDQKLCEQCGVCYNQFKCPAIIKSSAGDQESYFIDSGFCVDCGACVDICHFEAISEVGRN
jgi:indolepyruvate ferredoxin oxidoreductase alpha subunit